MAVTVDLVAYHHVVHAAEILAVTTRTRHVPKPILDEWQAWSGSDMAREFQAILGPIPPL